MDRLAMVENSEDDVESFLAFTLSPVEGGKAKEQDDHKDNPDPLPAMMTDEEEKGSSTLSGDSETAMVHPTCDCSNGGKNHDAQESYVVDELFAKNDDNANVLIIAVDPQDCAETTNPMQKECWIAEEYQQVKTASNDVVVDTTESKGIETDTAITKNHSNEDENYEKNNDIFIEIPLERASSISAQVDLSAVNFSQDEAVADNQPSDCCDRMDMDDINTEEPEKKSSEGSAHAKEVSKGQVDQTVKDSKIGHAKKEKCGKSVAADSDTSVKACQDGEKMIAMDMSADLSSDIIIDTIDATISGGNNTLEIRVLEESKKKEDDEEQSDISGMSIISSEESLEEFSFGSDEEGENEQVVSKTIPETLSVTKPFNMNLLMECIAKGEFVIDQVTDEDVIAVVGKTGTGKSTLIQGIAGKSFHESIHENKTQSGFVETKVFEADDPLVGFEVGHSKSSMTKCINCFIQKTKSGSQVAYVDTPGFEDTEGPEIDIATSAMLIQVARKCRSLRFIVMVNYHSLLDDRGGAFRSILKFIRKFATGSFKDEQQSFMFLFTHTNEINDFPGDRGQAKLRLREEVTRTINGTEDEDVLGVLKFIQKSLQKGYPFVDIMSPLTTDFKLISSFAGGKSWKGLENKQTNAALCGLTTTSQLKLGVHVHELVEEVRSMLTTGDVCLLRLDEIQRVFRYFEKYLCFGEVRRSIIECKEMLKVYIVGLETIVEKTVEKGTSLESHDIFTKSSVSTLQQTIRTLSILCEDYSSQSCWNRIINKVEAYQRSILDMYTTTYDLTNLHLELDKLRAWSDCGTPELSGLYKDAIRHISALIDEILKSVDSFDLLRHADIAVEDKAIRTFFRQLKCLQSLNGSIEGLNSHGLSIEETPAQAYAKLQMLENRLRDWPAMADNQPVWPENFEPVKAKIEVLGTLSSILRKDFTCPELLSLVDRTCETLMSQTIEFCENNRKKLTQLFRQIFDSGNICGSQDMEAIALQVLAFSHVNEIFAKGGGESSWKQINLLYTSLIDDMASVLRTRAGECEEMARATLKYGLKDENRDASFLIVFQKCRWFDEYLPQEKRFVKCCAVAVENKYQERTANLTTYVETILEVLDHDLADGQSARANELVKIKLALEEISKLQRFGATTDSFHLSKAGFKALPLLDKYIMSRVETWPSLKGQWEISIWATKEKDFELRISNLNAVLNDYLAEIVAMLELQVGYKSKSAVIKVKKEVEQLLINFTKSVHRKLDSPATFDEVYKVLHVVKALGRYPLTAVHLPQYDELMQIARGIVTIRVHHIEKMVGETAEIEESERLINELSQAESLGRILGQDVLAHVNSLKKHLGKKEEEVDGILSTMIQNNDYRGMNEFLLPLSKVKDQIRKQKYVKCKQEIAESLKPIEIAVLSALDEKTTQDNFRFIASNMEILVTASSEIGSFMTSVYDVRFVAEKCKQSIQRKMSTFLERMEENTKKLDLVVMQRVLTRINLYLEHLEAYLTPNMKRRGVACQKGYDSLVKSMSDRISDFVRSGFIKENDLLVILDNLFVITEPMPHCLRCIYEDIVSNLESTMDEALRARKDFVTEMGCFDESIDAISCLKRVLENGLSKHLRTELMDEIDQLSVLFREARQKQEQDMDFQGPSAVQKLENWAGKLAKADPSAVSRPWHVLEGAQKIFYRKNYEQVYRNIQIQLESKAKLWYSRAHKSLDHRDYPSFQNSYEVLVLMARIIGMHLPTMDQDIATLKLNVEAHFISVCAKCIAALKSGECVEFERLFPNYRDCLLEVQCLDVSAKDPSTHIKLIHQLLNELMDKKVEMVMQYTKQFEFRKLEEVVRDARWFGGFVADHFSVLWEQLDIKKRLHADKWQANLVKLVDKHFQAGRYLGGIKYFALLGIVPSSSAEDIQKAFRAKSLKFHPDRCVDVLRKDEFKQKFQQLNQASEELQKKIQLIEATTEQAFDREIRGIDDILRISVKEALNDENYEHVELLYFKFSEMNVLVDLVKPCLDTQAIQAGVVQLVRDHIKKVRTKITSSWSEKDYKSLNHNINDLRLMEDKLNASMFNESWSSDGIMKSIEDEIISLANATRQFLKDKKTAKETRDEFRRCFMGLGIIMVELPMFKNFTKRRMSEVLESCLSHEWGYGYLFEFGNSLQRETDGVTSEEKRVAHIILNEFSSFKDVVTMIWNEEVSQKPAEVTIPAMLVQGLVDDSKSPLEQEKQHNLSTSFKKFDMRYRSLLSDYLQPGMDVSLLVYKTIASAEKIKPISCQSFEQQTKEAIPEILAGVFTVFTILKSGESYNRLEQSSSEGDIDPMKVLMRPHNIQIQALLAMFGCECPCERTLRSQLMQVRTGEGKSMILGAASVVFGLLGFNVRCVCYSEYLSKRDYDAFRDVFDIFGLSSSIKYTKITTLSEDTTAAKGDLRGMTLELIRSKSQSGFQKNPVETPLRTLKAECTPSTDSTTTSNSMTEKSTTATLEISARKYGAAAEHILLIDEVDVFFSSEFYGNTYNKAAMLKEPEIAEILRVIWAESDYGKKKVKLSYVKQLSAYRSLLQKFRGFDFILENEILRMLDEVRRLDESPYHLDRSSDRIGHKVMDGIDYDVNYGYRTIFAYLKEKDNLRNPEATLQRELGIKLSCGQFSYANISPAAVLGVSGTLEVMGPYEKSVLQRYGVKSFFYLPSVYGDSRFCFDQADPSTVSIEKGMDNYFLKITESVVEITRNDRAAIVFFANTERLNNFVSSPNYRKLGRNKNILKEDMTIVDKEFVIQRAATAGQITLSTAVFGRGTDFFCKDEKVESNGGVHVVQAFLSEELSEEIQIQGRTARQGKKGTYSMVLLDKDLEDRFGATVDNWSRKEYYKMLNEARKTRHDEHCKVMESNLIQATAKDQASHHYFDALLANDPLAAGLFKTLYLTMKKRPTPSVIDLDLCIAVDNTGSMRPYGKAITSTITSMIQGPSSFLPKLIVKFPETKFKVRLGLLAYRDIDDGNNQFNLVTQEFSENASAFLSDLNRVVSSPSGGGDICEDHLGAINFLTELDDPGCWESMIKVLLLLTDAPCHGYVPPSYSPSTDAYNVRHPLGLTVESVAGGLLKKDVDLFICSLNPDATSLFENELSEAFFEHAKNSEERRIISIPLVSKNQHSSGSVGTGFSNGSSKHIVFVLDESGSMSHNWGGVVVAYNNYMKSRLEQQHESDLVSVVQFDNTAHVTVQQQSITNAPRNLSYRGGGTCFSPAASSAYSVTIQTPVTHVPLVVFMSDGMADDSEHAAATFSSLNHEAKSKYGDELELHVIGFGNGTDTAQLKAIASTSGKGSLHTVSGIAGLSNLFVQIAGGTNVANVLEKEIGKRIYDAVTNRLSAEYAG